MKKSIRKALCYLLSAACLVSLIPRMDTSAVELLEDTLENQDEETKLKTGWYDYDGVWYYYNEDGELEKDCYVDGYWLDSEGAATYPYVAGWRGDAGNWWYGDETGWYACDGWYRIDCEWYYFDIMGLMCYNCYVGGCYLDDDGIYQDNEISRWAADISDSELAGYFRNSVIVGDSICAGFSMYCSSSGDPVANQFTFMASGSFGVHNALSLSNTTPYYCGVQRPIWESVAYSGTDHVYISMGMNDTYDSNLPEKYESLIGWIKQYSPGIQVTVCSITGVLPGHERGSINNANINWLNNRIRAMCARNGYGFIDLNSWTTDGWGLYSGYCSDGFVHQTFDSYARWLQAFKSYGRAELVKKYSDE